MLVRVLTELGSFCVAELQIGVGMAFSRHPSLRTGRADFPHPALQLVISPLRLARLGTGYGHRE